MCINVFWRDVCSHKRVTFPITQSFLVEYLSNRAYCFCFMSTKQLCWACFASPVFNQLSVSILCTSPLSVVRFHFAPQFQTQTFLPFLFPSWLFNWTSVWEKFLFASFGIFFFLPLQCQRFWQRCASLWLPRCLTDYMCVTPSLSSKELDFLDSALGVMSASESVTLRIYCIYWALNSNQSLVMTQQWTKKTSEPFESEQFTQRDSL